MPTMIINSNAVLFLMRMASFAVVSLLILWDVASRLSIWGWKESELVQRKGLPVVFMNMTNMEISVKQPI